MSEIKPLQIIPITVLWLQASYKPLEVVLEEERINLINIDLSTLLTFCHTNRLLNEKQRNDLRKKIDKRLDGMKGKDFDSFRLNSLMNVLFDVVSDTKRPQTHALANGVDVVVNYLLANKILTKKECNELTDIFSDNIAKMVDECPYSVHKEDC